MPACGADLPDCYPGPGAGGLYRLNYVRTGSNMILLSGREGEAAMAKVLCVLYDDPVDGYPAAYARDEIPEIDSYPGGPDDAEPARDRLHPRGAARAACRASWACAAFLEAAGHTLVVTSDKDGPDSVFERELADADIVISQPFWPAYLTRERIAKAKNLKLAITAGIGSDHYDLQAASEAGLTIAEITYSNSISVSEHVVMMILSLVRNYIPSYQLGGQGRLEHRRLRAAVLRPGGHGGRHRRRGADRVGGAAAAQAVRRAAALHRPAPAARGGRARSWGHVL